MTAEVKKNRIHTACEDRHDTLCTFLGEIDRIPMLSPQEEFELSMRAKNGDVDAQNRLTEANLRFVVSVAKEFQGRGMALEDLIQYGAMGLRRAAESFDPERGTRFISYGVWWIRQHISKALSENVRLVRLPVNRNTQYSQLVKLREKMEKESGRDVSLDELALEAGMDKTEVNDLFNMARPISSLDAPRSEDSGSVVGDLIVDASAVVEKRAEDEQMEDILLSAVEKLPLREREVLKYRFGLDGRETLSLKEIGEIFGLTKERIRQIEGTAQKHLIEMDEIRNLNVYIA